MSYTIIASNIHVCLLEVLYLPDWFPGSSLKREAKHARDLSIKLTEIPYQHVEERMVVPFLFRAESI